MTEISINCVELIAHRLFLGETVEVGGWAACVTFGHGGTNVNKMLASVRDASNTERFFGPVAEAAQMLASQFAA